MCNAINIPDVHFTIIGANNIGGISDDKFTFTGKVDDVIPYLSTFDIFGYPLCPDHYGTCEQVLGEAMAAGVVPVVMGNPAERLIVEDDFTGYIMGEEGEYIFAVKTLLSFPKERKRMAENARKRAKELYSLDTMIKKWENVFEEMMEKPKKGRGIF